MVYNGPQDPFTFAIEVKKAYRLYRQDLLTPKEFTDVTGELLFTKMNYSFEEEQSK